MEHGVWYLRGRQQSDFPADYSIKNRASQHIAMYFIKTNSALLQNEAAFHYLPNNLP